MATLEGIVTILLIISCVLTLVVLIKEEINVKWIRKINKSIFPILSIFLIITLLFLNTYNNENNIKSKKYSYEENYSDDYDYSNDYSSETSSDEILDFSNEVKKEQITLYEGTHMGGYDVIPGSYLAIANSTDSGNLFVYDSWGNLAYSQFYGSPDDENREGIPVYIEDAGEIKITGISSFTFVPIGD
ncbi:hypothetical protein K2V74_10280 [Mammaliicoccus sciuri]|uniref:hypothetical protein n=1 Tax=Mammaliicoccus sciuri TaxID=1296 RepID=UPI001E41383D|nr:hypothetical protein [Mammaliicoccus sciuri]MCD8874707.1 hypothetical protein [Mammaliicoccus sciuri]